MDPVFTTLAGVTLAAAVGAMALRRLVHCALCLAVALAGVAGLYLRLNAEFVGFAQVLVYVGAVAILVVFAILLTRHTELEQEPRAARPVALGVGVAALTTGVLLALSSASPLAARPPPDPVRVTVRAIGERLMTEYVLPLQVAGLLLTAALIGGVLLALREPAEPGGRPPTGGES